MSLPNILNEIENLENNKAPQFSKILEVTNSISITEEQLKSGLVVIAHPSSVITITIPNITSNDYTEMEIISYGTDDGIYLNAYNIRTLWYLLPGNTALFIPSGSAVNLKWINDFWIVIGNYEVHELN